MSKQPQKIDYADPADQAERAARRKGLTAEQIAEQDTRGEDDGETEEDQGEQDGETNEAPDPDEDETE